MKFEWDDSKNRQNLDKHGLTFFEARELFESGAEFLEIFDFEHSVTEERFIAMGHVRRGLIVVVWTERREGVIRVISARFATRREARAFDTQMKETNHE